MFGTGLPPSTIAAATAAIDVIQSTPELRHQLFANAQWLKTALLEAGFELLPSETQILPLILGASTIASQFADALVDYGVYAPAIRPPTVPEGTQPSANLRNGIPYPLGTWNSRSTVSFRQEQQ